MIVKVISENVCYVDMDGVLFYLDNSTDEKIVSISVIGEQYVEINGQEAIKKAENEKSE